MVAVARSMTDQQSRPVESNPRNGQRFSVKLSFSFLLSNHLRGLDYSCQVSALVKFG